MFLFCTAGVLLDYAVGAAWLVVSTGGSAAAFWPTLIGFALYLPFDAVKCAVAAGLCSTFAFVPGLARLSHIR